MIIGLVGKVAIVTGASQGIGLAIVEALLDEGVKVLMVARDKTRLEVLKSAFSKSGKDVDYIAGDVADPELVHGVLKKTNELWGNIDILVNNAGGPPMGSFLSHGSSEWSKAIDTNLLSVINFSKGVAPNMVTNNWGRIVSITSTLSKEPTPLMVLSATTRAGVSAFTKSISSELAISNVTANVICPGGVLTGRLESLIQTRAEKENREYLDILSESQASIPMNRFAEPSEIANTVLFLVSDLGSYVTGQSISVDGGLTKSF